MKNSVKFADEERVHVRVEVSQYHKEHGYIYRDDLIAHETMCFKYALPEFENIIGDADKIENDLANGYDYEVTFVIYFRVNGENIDVAKASCWVSEGLSNFAYEPCDNIAIIWEAVSERKGADSFSTVHESYDEALAAARMDIAHMTASERRNYIVSVQSRIVDISDPDLEDLPENPTVKDIYNAAMDADVYPIDPLTYEEIY